MSDPIDEFGIIDAEIVETPNVPSAIEESSAIGAANLSSTEPMKLPNRQDAVLADNPERRCVAHKKNGDRCRKFAIAGATVCRVHGGAAPHVLRAAKARLENAADRMAEKLLGIAVDETLPAETRLKAIKDALDRSMGRPTSTVEVGPIEPKPWEEIFDQIGGSPAQSYAVEGHEVNDNHTTTTAGYGFNGFGAKTSESPDSSREHPSVEYLERLRQESTREFTRERPAQTGEQPTSEPPKPAMPAQHHITGEDALAINARLIREQRAIESPHKRYARP